MMGIEEDFQLEEQVHAQEAGLKYVTDKTPGITRKSGKGGFEYFDSEGRAIRNELIIQRIKQLVLPPAWEKVWICANRNGHLQATGYDKKGRKQYRYHSKWTQLRNEKKFLGMKEFGRALPQIRQQLEKDLRKKTLCKEKVLATAIALLDKTLIRIGNEEYMKENDSFGLTTLRDEHVKKLGQKVKIEFKGKRKIEQEIVVSDKKLAGLIKKCKDIPGYELFQYYDEGGERHKIHSEDVNSYLKEISGLDITAKYFRTWGGSCVAINALMEFEETDDEKLIKKNVVAAIKKVSGCLGNTPSVCRKYYIHPVILEKYTEKELISKIHESQERGVKDIEGLAFEEEVFLKILEEIK